MANLLKPSVDQIVFGRVSQVEPVRRRSNRDGNGSVNVSFLAQDDDREPVATKIAGLFRAIEAAIIVVTGLASVGRI
jgi:hypothetical protein